MKTKTLLDFFIRLIHLFKLSSKTHISQHIMDTVEEHMERVDV